MPRDKAFSALLRLFALLLLFMTASQPARAHEALKFGVFPNLSARVMVETYQPLANYLGETLRHPVHLESAPDFLSFHTRTQKGEYEVLLTAPHLAWLAMKKEGYRPILTYLEPARGYLIVRADSPYRHLADLRGRTIAMPDPLAVVNIRMEKILEKAGLRLGQEFKAVDSGSHTNAATYVSQGQADAAVVGVLSFLRLPKDVQEGLRVIEETQAMPSHVFMVRADMDPGLERGLTKAIESFVSTEQGQAFLKKGGFGGVRPLRKDELKVMELDARELEHRLETSAGSQ